ncbi:DivIVA domain-containing protein [Cellulomonas sp. CW35]|uniref:DivIVA domain-containing protein n=1 Tax=Cellulomonas sp. CW35 TaxID=3458249 RepID=UPI004034AA20
MTVSDGPGSGEPISAETVLHVRFITTKFTEGYDQSEVDDFLDRVIATLRAREAGEPGELGAEEVAGTTFSRTRFREGYAMDEVDDFLDRIATALAGGAPRTSATPPVAHDRVVADVPDPGATPGLIPPRRGWRRLFGG